MDGLFGRREEGGGGRRRRLRIVWRGGRMSNVLAGREGGAVVSGVGGAVAEGIVGGWGRLMVLGGLGGDGSMWSLCFKSLVKGGTLGALEVGVTRFFPPARGNSPPLIYNFLFELSSLHSTPIPRSYRAFNLCSISSSACLSTYHLRLTNSWPQTWSK